MTAVKDFAPATLPLADVGTAALRMLFEQPAAFDVDDEVIPICGPFAGYSGIVDELDLEDDDKPLRVRFEHLEGEPIAWYGPRDLMPVTTVRPVETAKSLEFHHPDTRTPQQARRWLGRELTAARVPAATVEVCESVVTELAANAGQHIGGRILVSALVMAHGVQVSVFDGGQIAPERWQRAGGLDDERGRGNVIVAALADEVTVTMRPSGKTVTALIGHGARKQSR